MPKIDTFPQVIFVTVQEDGKDDWLSSTLTKDAALGDAKSEIVGTYKFVAAEEVSKGPIVAKRVKGRHTK